MQVLLFTWTCVSTCQDVQQAAAPQMKVPLAAPEVACAANCVRIRRWQQHPAVDRDSKGTSKEHGACWTGREEGTFVMESMDAGVPSVLLGGCRLRHGALRRFHGPHGPRGMRARLLVYRLHAFRRTASVLPKPPLQRATDRDGWPFFMTRLACLRCCS